MTRLRPARLRLTDIVRVAGAGLRGAPLRAGLSAAGIAVGIAAMVTVVGISSSSRADIDRTLAHLGTNLLSVGPGQTLTGEPSRLPREAVEMVDRIGPVLRTSATGTIAANVYRTDLIPAAQSNSIAVLAVRLDLPATVGAAVRRGDWFTGATARLPTVVLGSATAERIGVHAPGLRIWIGGQWFGVIGILDSVPLAPELDTAALVGWPAAEAYLSFDGHPSTIYTRSVTSQVEAVRAVLPATANPAAPNEVRVSRPSDALAAQRATDRTLTTLLLALAATALVVGWMGVMNTMLMVVLERRPEIGLRRSLGATRGQIRTQFLVESLLLSGLGGVAGIAVGYAATATFAVRQAWPVAVPVTFLIACVAGTAVVGTLAGIVPAVRAAALSPTAALTSR